MLVIAIIGGFIAGVIAGYFMLMAYVKHVANMTYDELCEVGTMTIKAGNNRVSTLTLCTEDGGTDVMTFEK